MTNKNRHLVIVNYAYDKELSDPEELLERYFLLTDWANACCKQNVKVTVFQRFKSNSKVLTNDVEYHFLQDSLPPAPTFYHCALNFNQQIQKHIKSVAASSDYKNIAVHINGLIFPASILQLCFGLDKTVRCVIQHHAERPRSRLHCLLNRMVNQRIVHYFFTTKFHSDPWVKLKAIANNKVVELMEGSSNCKAQDKDIAKRKLGLKGEPLLLWTANLDNNKDPLTILTGFEQFLEKYQNARLIMVFRNSTLLETVTVKINNSIKLTNSVKLIGEVSYQNIADYYNAADIFVQGSTREGSGIAVLDALACGAIPVITQIPSFIALTKNGQVGVLWPRAEANRFFEALCQVMQENLISQQQDCRSIFELSWSFNEITNRAMKYYFEDQT